MFLDLFFNSVVLSDDEDSHGGVLLLQELSQEFLERNIGFEVDEEEKAVLLLGIQQLESRDLELAHLQLLLGLLLPLDFPDFPHHLLPLANANEVVSETEERSEEEGVSEMEERGPQRHELKHVVLKEELFISKTICFGRFRC